MIAKVPLGIIAVHIKLSERRSTVAYRYQNQFLVRSRYFLGHDAVSAVGQLVDSP